MECSVRTIIQKYGGSSLDTTAKVQRVAQRVVATQESGYRIVVVVSAMGNTTDQLVDLARQISADPPRREFDALLATGEMVSVALLAMAIQDLGKRAVGLNGLQCGILTNDVHSNARILEIRPGRVREHLANNEIVVAAGFQGFTSTGDFTTLGRGGSDTTAVALAAALGAERCEIYTDVAGVLTADPLIVPEAKYLDRLGSAVMQELAWSGAKVLKAEAVEFAASNHVPIVVRSTFENGHGTWVHPQPELAEPYSPRGAEVAGVSGRKDVIRITLHPKAFENGEGELVIDRIAGFDMISGRAGSPDQPVDILISNLEIPNAEAFTRDLLMRFGHCVSVTDQLGVVSIVGFGLGSRPAAFHRAYKCLAEAHIGVVGTFTTRESFSFLVAAAKVNEAVRLMHEDLIEKAPPKRAFSGDNGSAADRIEAMKVVELLESTVRTYSRAFPAVFSKARGCYLSDERGRDYLDFFSGAGALNYGHNHPRMKQRLIKYLESDGITHSLDMATSAKQEFLTKFNALILRPRNLEYKVQFAGPTGTNAVEAALKLARKFSGRHNVIHFMNSFHGMTMGSLGVTGNVSKRASAGVPLNYSLPMFFDGDLGPHVDTMDYLENLLDNPGNGVGLPAAVIVETIQAEGGVKVASNQWLRRLEKVTRQRGILLIVDDIQVGCGRTGDFFSFEDAGVRPDIVCLSKSISGYGLPMAIVLIRPEIDIWRPGEHTGTFRGNNLAFVTAVEALDYWQGNSFSKAIVEKSKHVSALLRQIAEGYAKTGVRVRGRGLIHALVFEEAGLAVKISKEAFEHGLIIETCGAENEALKLLPPLNISREELDRGISIIADCVSRIRENATVQSVTEGSMLKTPAADPAPWEQNPSVV